MLGCLRPDGFDWLVPGARPELVVATIRALPKRVRRRLVPAPDVGARVWKIIHERIPGADGDGGDGGASAPSIPFRRAFTEAVARLKDVEITDADWAEAV